MIKPTRNTHSDLVIMKSLCYLLFHAYNNKSSIVNADSTRLWFCDLCFTVITEVHAKTARWGLIMEIVVSNQSSFLHLLFMAF